MVWIGLKLRNVIFNPTELSDNQLKEAIMMLTTSSTSQLNRRLRTGIGAIELLTSSGEWANTGPMLRGKCCHHHPPLLSPLVDLLLIRLCLHYQVHIPRWQTPPLHNLLPPPSPSPTRHLLPRSPPPPPSLPLLLYLPLFGL